MSEIKSNIEVKVGSEKSFGIVFAVVFLVIGLFPLIGGDGVRYWSLAIAIAFVIVAFFAPHILAQPNRLWFKFGMILGAIVAPIVMILVYFIAVAPVGLIVRLIGKDLLRQKVDKTAKSYWIKRDQPVGSMRNQF